MTYKPELALLLAYWQPRLRLQDWDIVGKYKRAEEMPKPEVMGHINWVMSCRRAVMFILEPVDYPLSCADFPQDIEKTVVHELLHLHFEPAAPVDMNVEAKMMFECAIDHTARALVDLRRDSSPFRREDDAIPEEVER